MAGRVADGEQPRPLAESGGRRRLFIIASMAAALGLLMIVLKDVVILLGFWLAGKSIYLLAS